MTITSVVPSREVGRFSRQLVRRRNSSIAMIADVSVDRYYYIYDSRERRALVLDRVTGSECTTDHGPRARLISHVKDHRSPALVRRFARWCARSVGAEEMPLHTVAGRLWAAGRRDDESAWQRVRRDTNHAAMLAMTLGLSRGRADAAQLLVLQACTHPDPQQAALDAAHMSERWAEFMAESEPESAARSMRTKHVDWLLDALAS